MKIIDIHCHVGLSVDGAGITYEELCGVLDEHPVEKVVLLPIDEADKGETYSALNDNIHQLAERDSRIVPFGRINPHAGAAAIAEIERVAELGFGGLKLHPYSEDFEPAAAREIIKKAGEAGLPVLIHSSQKSFREELDGWLEIFELARTPVIAAHNGKDNYRRLAAILPRFPNLYVDTTAASYFRTKYMYETAGPDRLVFGSDLPYSHPAVERVKYDLILDPADREKVFYRNAASILGKNGVRP